MYRPVRYCIDNYVIFSQFYHNMNSIQFMALVERVRPFRLCWCGYGGRFRCRVVLFIGACFVSGYVMQLICMSFVVWRLCFYVVGVNLLILLTIYYFPQVKIVSWISTMSISMRLLSRNCWGLGNPLTVWPLHNLVKMQNPAFFFL